MKYGKKAFEAASFVVIGFGFSQVIRLAGNIILTRLLVPEIFGIIMLARVFYIGLGLFSDVGLEPAIIRSNRAKDPVFLNTAWTIQIIRSVILALLSAAIAYPVSVVYKEPALLYLIPLIGLISVPDGCRSTSLTLMNRELQQKTLTIMELVIQVCSLVSMIAAAYFMRNIWALLVGDLVAAVMRTAWSHCLNREQPNAFVLEKESVGELLHFGKWIMLSTALMFLASQSDRFMLGKFFSMAWFGVYGIAVNLAELPKAILNRLNGKVIYPLIVKYADLSRDELRAKIQTARGGLLLGVLALLALFGSFGDVAVRILYDERYEAAAWILPMLVFGMWPLILISTVEGGLLAIGKPMYSSMGNLAKFIYMIIAIPLGFALAGEFGVIVAIAFNDLPTYLIISYGLVRERISLVRQDLLLTLALILFTAVLFGIRFALGMGLPGSVALF